jgi:hypothetical protein
MSFHLEVQNLTHLILKHSNLLPYM